MPTENGLRAVGNMRVSVLIVDDERAVRAAVKRILEREQQVRVVGEAGDGEEAVQMARDLRPDVVLMDITMPRLDGLQATRRIKAERPDAKVIILTVHLEEGYRQAAGESGADAFLPKKVSIDDLIETLRRVGSGGKVPHDLDPGSGRQTGSSMVGGTRRSLRRGAGNEPTDPGGRG